MARAHLLLAPLVGALAVGLASPGAAAEPQLPAVVTRPTRTGLAVVAISAPDSPVAVVQLHVRLAGNGLPPAVAAAAPTLLDALAEGRVQGQRGPGARDDVAAAGGTTRVQRHLDGGVVSDVVAAADLDVALRAMDKRLRARRRLDLAGPPPLVVDGSGPGAPPEVVRQLLAPGHIYAASRDGPASPDDVTALADQALRRDSVVLVVVGRESAGTLLGRVNLLVRTPLPRGSLLVSPVSPLVGTRVVEGATPGRGRTRVWFPTAARAERPVSRRAAAAVLGWMVSAHDGQADGLGWWMVESEDASGEEARLEQLRSVATAPLDERWVRTAAAQVRADRLAALAHPEVLALRIGQASLAGEPDAVEEELAAYPGVAVADVQAEAQRLLHGPRVVVRGDGG